MSVTRILVNVSGLERPQAVVDQVRQAIARMAGAFDVGLLLVRAEGAPEGPDDRAAGSETIVVETPNAPGRGECVKLAIRYASLNGYQVLVDLRDEGPSAIALLPDLVSRILSGTVHGAFGSPLVGRAKGRFPWRPGRLRRARAEIVSSLHRMLLKSDVADFVPPVRAWSIKALGALPYERNADDDVFDTQLFLQMRLKGLELAGLRLEGPLASPRRGPGLGAVWRMLRCCVRYRLHLLSIFYQREFDVDPDLRYYEPKLGYPSSHTTAIERVPAGARVLDLGCNEGEVAKELKKKACHVVGVDFFPVRTRQNFDVFVRQDLDDLQPLTALGSFDCVLLLDVIEHLDKPEDFLERLRGLLGATRPLFVVTTANVAFIVTRLQLLLSSFNYGKQGVLDLTHKRLFTYGSLRRAFEQAGYDIGRVGGIPAPFPKAFGMNALARLLLMINVLLIRFSRSLFSYQIYLEAVPRPSLDDVLRRSLAGRRARGAAGEDPQ